MRKLFSWCQHWILSRSVWKKNVYLSISINLHCCHRNVSIWPSFYWMADWTIFCTFLSSGLIWAISMATLLVFHTQEWLVKYSRTIMDLWRRVIVFIILRRTNSRGRTAVKGGTEQRETETTRWRWGAPGKDMPAKEEGQAMQRRKEVGWGEMEGPCFQRRFPEIRDFLDL